ncbi:hypothetical protein DBR42_00850 [Pelomonas sp. HMWF004]|nr:hypothetical protein DBR42_00850 [Pelomonas sp. HMWF004]
MLKIKISAAMVAFSSLGAQAQTMAQDITAHWVSYIVVSSSLPQRQLVSLARDAAVSNSVMVLNGFVNGQNSIPEAQRFITEINQQCCTREKPSRWIIDPKLVARYSVRAAPTFILARGESMQPADWSKVAGDLDLASALKVFAQKSRSADLRQQATDLYNKTFAAP